MAAAVRIDFTIGGEDAVRRAVQSILQATEKAAKQEVRTAKTASDNVTKIRKEGAQKTARETASVEDAGAKKSAATARRKQEALGAEMARDIRETERTAKRKETIERTALRRGEVARGASMSKDLTETQRTARRKQEALGASMAMDIRETQRAARKKQEALGASIDADIRASARSTKKKEDDAKSSARRLETIHASRLHAGFREQEREERREKAATVRKEARVVKASTAATRGLYSETGQGAARGLRSGLGTLAAGGGLLAGAIGTGGIISAVESSMGLESTAAQLAADVRTGDGKFLNQGALVGDAQRVAKSTGIKSESVMDAMSIAASEGGGAEGLQAFRGALDQIGVIALASGTKIEDLASVSATMSNNLITSSKDQVRLMMSINAAAKTGNVGFRAMAANVMEVAGMHQAMSFAGTAERRIELSSGMIQMAKQGGAGSAAEAATSARSFMSDLVGDKSLKLLESKGIKAYTKDQKGNKVARDVEDLTIDIFKATKGDPQKLNKIFDIRSKMTQSSISAAFNKDGEAGIRALFKEFTGAKQTDKQINQEADLQKATASNQVSRAMEDFKARVGSDLLPALVQLIPHFRTLAETVAGMVKEFATAPKEMIAKFLAASIALSAAQAAVGNVAGRAASSLLDKFLGKVSTMNVTAAVVNTAGSAAGAIASNPAKALGVAAAGVGGFLLGRAAFKASEGAIDADTKASDTRGAAMEAYSITGTIGSSKERVGDRERLLELQKKIKDEQEKSAWTRFKEGSSKAYDRVKGGDDSFSAISGLALRGVGDAVYGSQQARDDTTSKDALKEIAAALAKPKSDEGLALAVTGLATAINAKNLMGPKAPDK